MGHPCSVSGSEESSFFRFFDYGVVSEGNRLQGDLSALEAHSLRHRSAVRAVSLSGIGEVRSAVTIQRNQVSPQQNPLLPFLLRYTLHQDPFAWRLAFLQNKYYGYLCGHSGDGRVNSRTLVETPMKFS